MGACLLTHVDWLVKTQAMEVVYIVIILLVGILVYLAKNKTKAGMTPFLDGSRQQLTLIDKMELSHDVRRFRLGLPSENHILGLPPGKHLQVFAPGPIVGCVPGEWNGKTDAEADTTEISRKYTPTTCDH